MSEYDRFKQEDYIMQAWSICEDIELVVELLESDDPAKTEKAVKSLVGLVTMGHLRFNRIFNEFERGIRGES